MKRVAGGVAIVVLFVVASATAAAAHANLVSTSPAQSARFPAGSGPRTVTLVFDERVNATAKSVGIYDGSGRGVALTTSGSRTTKRLGVGVPRLADGTYVVVWHVISDDGHPEHGAFTFTVGAGGATLADIGGLLASGTSGRAVGVGFGLDRAVGFLACLGLVGGLVFARWRWPVVLDRADVRRVLVGVAAVAVVATLLSLPLQAAYAGSGFDDVLAARFGRAALVRAALLVLLGAIVLGRRRGFVAPGLAGVAVMETFAYAGHGYTGRWPALGFLLDVTHLGAAALWLGGLVLLAFAMRGRPSDGSAAARFSAVALPAIAVVVLSGVVQGARQIDSWWALWHTRYARLLTIKVLIVLAIIVIASSARDALRDRHVSRGGTDVLEDVRTGVLLEAALAVVVLAVTSTLVVTAPAREEAAVAHRPVVRTMHVTASAPHVDYAVAVQPAIPGDNTIVVSPRLTSRGYLPAALTATVRTASGSTTVTFTPLADGRWVGTASVPRGEWTLDLAGTSGAVSEPATARLRFS